MSNSQSAACQPHLLVCGKVARLTHLLQLYTDPNVVPVRMSHCTSRDNSGLSISCSA